MTKAQIAAIAAEMDPPPTQVNMEDMKAMLAEWGYTGVLEIMANVLREGDPADKLADKLDELHPGQVRWPILRERK